ncbi:uncharacterized protein LOC143286910 isoform X3 [Babylonia areolata]|uniref:uncharacterized protein LOC143286910 isoform X3 n=1 Tax=Babylonia areolata TaxID=304850 RepID=UPI003FCF3F12
MNLGMCVLCALFGICFMWLDTMASEASESKRSCVTGPFNFEDGKDGWNTTDTKWHRKCSISDFGFNYFMSASLSRKYAASSTLTSPSLCATHNGTYLLSFRYSISGLVGYTPCFLAVNLLREDGVSTRIWRSSGLTHSIFQTVSPPVMFRSCSSQFRLEFEAVKVTSGPCGLILGTAFDFDDVRYLHVGDNTSSNDQCSGIAHELDTRTIKSLWTTERFHGTPSQQPLPSRCGKAHTTNLWMAVTRPSCLPPEVTTTTDCAAAGQARLRRLSRRMKTRRRVPMITSASLAETVRPTAIFVGNKGPGTFRGK